MKKGILIIAVLLVLCVTGGIFAACSNVNQINFIHVVARDYERFTYKVQWVETDPETQKEVLTDIGTMTLTFQRLEKKDEQDSLPKYTIDGKEYTLASGGVIQTDLVIDNAESPYSGEEVHSTVLFQDKFSPIASYKQYITTDTARAYISAIDYVSLKKKASITVNGVTQTFKIPSYCFDNDSLYYLVRGSDLGQASYSLSVSGVDNLQGGTRSVTIGKNATMQPINVPLFGEGQENTIDTYMVSLSAASTYGNGTVVSIFFKQSYEHTNAAGKKVDINKLPVRIDEGKVRYVITGVSTDKA